MFTNKDGIHIVVRYYEYPAGNVFIYYLINSSGTVLRNTTFTTESGAQYPKISGDNEKVYLAYKLGNYIKVKSTTDAGVSWYTGISSLPIGGNPCNGIDIVYKHPDLHVVYAMQDNGSNYETYYYKLNSNSDWVDYKNVTDFTPEEVGGFPSVTVSNNRVHVSYNTGNAYYPTTNIGDAKSLDKYIDTWQDPQVILQSPTGSSMWEIERAGSSKLLNFYYKFIWDGDSYYSDLYSKERDFNSTGWSGETLIQNHSSVTNVVSVANTLDGSTHIVYPGIGKILFRSYSNGSWTTESSLSQNGYLSPKIATTSNDMFVVYGSNSYPGIIKYKQYDAYPAPPSAPSSTWNANNYVKITWAANMEPDIASYKVYKMIEGQTGWVQIGSVNYSLNTNTYSYIDQTVTPGSRFDPHYNIHYKVTAKDLGNKESLYSPETVINGSTYYLWKQKSDTQNEVAEYGINQNYPNPFNPSTTINYQIPERSMVTLKVYDVLGNEVAELVNEWKETGSYTVQFSAGELASGMYIYRLDAVGNAGVLYNETKRMLLLK